MHMSLPNPAHSTGHQDCLGSTKVVVQICHGGDRSSEEQSGGGRGEIWGGGACGQIGTSICGQDCNPFGSVMRRASPKGDNAVTLLCLNHPHTFINLKPSSTLQRNLTAQKAEDNVAMVCRGSFSLLSVLHTEGMLLSKGMTTTTTSSSSDGW